MGFRKDIPIGKAVEGGAETEVEGHGWSTSGRPLPDPASQFRTGAAGAPAADPVIERTMTDATEEPEVSGHHVGSADAPASERGDRDRRR